MEKSLDSVSRFKYFIFDFEVEKFYGQKVFSTFK